MESRAAADRLSRRTGYVGWVPFVLLFAALGVAFYGGLAAMVDDWSREEYSHGYLIPLITAGMVWRLRARLAAEHWIGNWVGVAMVAFAMLMLILGELSTLYIIIQYAFLLTLAGLVVAFAGWSVLRMLAAPLTYLFFMIPLPNFFYNTLSQKLQLLSSAMGVSFMRLFDVSVFLEGNV